MKRLIVLNQARFLKFRFLIIVGLALIMLAASATWVLAQTDGVIYACVVQDGTIRIVPDANQCKKNESLLSWNILGPKGDPGLACWDLDEDGVADPEEDISLDGSWNTADCQGPQGVQGIQGPQGEQGIQGLQGEQGLQGPEGPAGPQGPQGPAGVVQRPGYASTVVDSYWGGSYSFGQYTSITIGADGLPVMSYYDGIHADLKAAHCNDVACSSATFATLDSAGNVGKDSSISIGSDGLPVISYFDQTNLDLKVAHCNDVACSSANLATLDSAGNVGQYTSITVGVDGLTAISYFEFYNGTFVKLKVAHCNDVTCSSATLATLFNGNTYVNGTSITIGSDGLPLISFHGQQLKVAHCNDQACNSATLADLDNTYGNGYLSITIGTDGLPIISYHNSFNKDLKVAHCNDVACSSATFATLDSAGDVGEYSSISIGSDGLPVISYFAWTNWDLKVAHCNDVACNSATLAIADSLGDVGQYTSITIGVDGLPVISYHHMDGGLVSVHCSNRFCIPYSRQR